jgi:hypothetical protein
VVDVDRERREGEAVRREIEQGGIMIINLFPVKWQWVGGGAIWYQNLPDGVLVKYPEDYSFRGIYVPGTHIVRIDPEGDRDEPKPGFYWVRIDALDNPVEMRVTEEPKGERA